MRLVIKVGTQVIADKTGLIPGRIRQIVSETAELLKAGHQVILVSSGAVAAGMAKLTHLNAPVRKKIWAAVGQPVMMESYAKELGRLGFGAGQILILRDDFTNRESFMNMVGIVESLLTANVLPIINENDVMKTEDLTLGDNDILSAMTAVAFSADKLLILTTEDGLYDNDPNQDPDAKLIKKVSDIDFEIERLCSKKTTALGSGGMLSKVRAAKHAVSAGIEVLIGNGRKKGIILSVVAGNFPGTRFTRSGTGPINETKRWMMSAKGVGLVIVDDGAVKALISGKSLLLPGILSVRGNFEKKEIVEVISRSGQAVAYGRTNYGSDEVQKALVEKKKQVKEKGVKILDREVIHRDYMVILSSNCEEFRKNIQ